MYFFSSIIYCQNLFLGACYIGAEIVLTVSAQGPPFFTSESDVCRRQILTYKEDPALKDSNGHGPITQLIKRIRKS